MISTGCGPAATPWVRHLKSRGRTIRTCVFRAKRRIPEYGGTSRGRLRIRLLPTSKYPSSVPRTVLLITRRSERHHDGRTEIKKATPKRGHENLRVPHPCRAFCDRVGILASI